MDKYSYGDWFLRWLSRWLSLLFLVGVLDGATIFAAVLFEGTVLLCGINLFFDTVFFDIVDFLFLMYETISTESSSTLLSLFEFTTILFGPM